MTENELHAQWESERGGCCGCLLILAIVALALLVGGCLLVALVAR